MKVLRLQNAYYVARDMDRMRAFYDEALGLPLKFADGRRWVQYNGVSTNFSLSSVEEAAADSAGAVVVFEVDALDGELAARIARHGGQVLGERDMGAHGRTLAFADPEGNVVQLFARANAR